jgi:polyphosphate kinase
MIHHPPAEKPVSTSRFLNRQLSWHAFNRRVLALAEDTSLPFADRMRFVSIWANNLDEYFLVRVASMKDDALNERIRIVDDGVTSTSQYEARSSATNPAPAAS